VLEIRKVRMNVRKLLKVFGRKYAVLPGPAGRDLPKREDELRGRVGRLASAGRLSVLGAPEMR